MAVTEVYILGQKYALRGDEPPEYLEDLARLVDERLKEVYAHSPNITPLRAAILTALNIADEMHKIKKEYALISQSIKSIEDKADSIISLFE